MFFLHNFVQVVFNILLKKIIGKNAPQDLLQKIAKNDDTKYKSLNSFSQLNHKLIAQFGFCPEIKHSLKLTVS